MRSMKKTLQTLWTLLKPGIDLPAQKSKQWSELGFQGMDPATDFRGMGYLGLLNLLRYAAVFNSNARATLLDSNSPSNTYPFAITGINITSWILGMLKQGQLNEHFYINGVSFDEFCSLYSNLFTEFGKFYVASKPKNIMDFPDIMNKFKERTVSKLRIKGHIYKTVYIKQDKTS